jgi:HK97 family phage major capsid protein
MITLEAKKGAIFTDVSNELMMDGLGFETQLTMALRKSISRGMDNGFINGSGAGRPQGILSSPSLIQIAGESGQDSDTLLYANIAKQYARMYPGGRRRAVWLASDTCIPSMLQMSLPVGTGGSAIPVLRETDGRFTMLGRPVYFTELMPVIGDANCLVFCDVSQYAVGIRKEMSIDVSNAPGWTQDLTSLRIIVRFDGQGTWAKPITPKKGDTQSWAVGIEAI